MRVGQKYSPHPNPPPQGGSGVSEWTFLQGGEKKVVHPPLPLREGVGGRGISAPRYDWVVDVAGIAGAVAFGLLFGVPGIIIGGALLATLAVPARRALARRAAPRKVEEPLSLPAEMGVTAGASLLFGGVLMGASIGARAAATRVASFAARRAAIQGARASAAGKLAARFVSPAKKFYVKKGHLAARGVGAAAAGYDLRDGSLDTGWGFAGAIYSGNLLYGRFFGTNVFGLDTAAPLSIATYQMFRTLAGADPFDFSDFNFNEAIRFRYISEFGNILQSGAIYGRAYFRPDLRHAIAAEKGLRASNNTGLENVSPFGWLVDKTLVPAYRRLPSAVKTVIRPTVHYPQGPLVRSKIGKRLTILEGFKNNDLMKPVYGPSGRFLSLGQVWTLVVPYQIFGAPLMGMSPGEWGPNRYWKMTSWSLVGNPVKWGLGGDTPAAQAAGFGVGLLLDAAITQWYNPRYKGRHWENDFKRSLERFEKEPENRDEIAQHIFKGIFLRQMTDWNLKSFVAGEGLRQFNPDYLKTFEPAIAGEEEAKRFPLWVEYLRAQAMAGDFLSKREVAGFRVLESFAGAR